MRILLVRAKPNFIDLPLVIIPMGLALIAAVAERLNHQVEILDLELERNQEAADERLRGKLREGEFDLVGFTAMTVEYESAARAARLVKLIAPSATIVFGGQHPTIQSEDVLSQGFCDFVVRGEGEAVFSEFITALSTGGPLESVKGLAFKRNGGYFYSGDHGLIPDLDTLPYPAYHLLNLEEYIRLAPVSSPWQKHKRAMPLFTSRGCPWRCYYCHNLFGKSFRARSPENVLGELKLLYDRWGIREFLVLDDVFNLDLDRAKRIFDLVMDSRLKCHFLFYNGLRVERFDEELVQKMAAAGTYHAALGIESASPRIQKIIRKNVKLDQCAQTLSWLHKYHIRTVGFFMLGFPTETRPEIEQTIQYARDHEFDLALFSIATPYPGTELNRQVKELGLYNPDAAVLGGEKYRMIRTDQLDSKTLKKLQRKAYLTFYTSRQRFLRMIPILLDVKSLRHYSLRFAQIFLAYSGARSSRTN
jgi:anaerobic magnesium-protoporphyrin IX monomethyl ester cyclase